MFPRERQLEFRSRQCGGKYNTKEVWHDKDGNDSSAHELLRRRKHQILRRGAVPSAQRGFRRNPHHGGISPAWPITYDDLEPYYTQAENLYHVHGKRGEDPTEPPAQCPYPYPAVSHEPRIQQLPTISRVRSEAVSHAARRHARREESA